MDVFEAIFTRRSVRKFKKTPINRQTLRKVFEAARWAPSWANTQCWRFIVVEDEEIKVKLADTLSPRNPARQGIRDAPVVIVVCAELGKSGYIRGNLVTDKGEWWYMFDVALAVQNLTLAAHALGLGTVNVGYFDSEKVRELLEIPENVEVIEIIPLGYPDEIPRTPPRKELSEIVFCKKYGNPCFT